MNPQSEQAAWDMVETLTRSGLVVPPLGAVAPSTIRKRRDFHWSNREIDVGALYGFNVETVAYDVAERGAAFTFLPVRNSLIILATAPLGDVVLYWQHGFGSTYGGVEEGDIANVNSVCETVARQWAARPETGVSSDAVRWLAYQSFGTTGFVDLDAIRDGAPFDDARQDFGDAETIQDANRLLEEVLQRCITEPRPRSNPADHIMSGALMALVDDDGVVVSLFKADNDGDMRFRHDGEWKMVVDPTTISELAFVGVDDDAERLYDRLLQQGKLAPIARYPLSAEGPYWPESGDASIPTSEPSDENPTVAQLVPHLAEALRRLKDDSHLVISVHGSIRYVQFATFRPNLRLETIGTRYLEDAGEAWSVDEVVWLADHGWHDADDDGNLWRHWIPADENAAAQAAIDALVNVHGVTSLDQVWFQSEDDNALAALEATTPARSNTSGLVRPVPPGDLQPTNPERAAEINAVLNAALREDAEGVADMPDGTTYLVIVDYVARSSVLELLAFNDGKIFRRHDGRWYIDPAWIRALEKAPAKSVVLLASDQLERVRPKVDASTQGQPWKKFDTSTLEMYWPSYRPKDPDMFDPSQLLSPPTADSDRSASDEDGPRPEEPQPVAHPMFEVLTDAGIVVPHLGCTDPTDIEEFGDWHWGTRELDRIAMYLFNVESIARDLAEHGPMFALSHGGHGANSYALTLLSTSPRRDAAFLTQSGFGGAYANEDADLQRINDTNRQLHHEWVEFSNDRPRNEIYWLAYASPMRSTSGFVNLSTLRRTGSFERANTRLETDVAGMFDVFRRRLAFNPARFLNISSNLKDALRLLRPGTHLTIGVRGSNRHIRLSRSGSNLVLETTGMHDPEPGGGALTPEQMQWLIAEGWHYKDYGTEGPELRRELTTADHSEAVRIVLEVLRKAYAVQALEELWFGCPDEAVLAAIAEHGDALQLRKE